VNEKFDVGRADWSAAETAVKKCQVLPWKETGTGSKSTEPRKSSTK
jgi:hypothetical protein